MVNVKCVLKVEDRNADWRDAHARRAKKAGKRTAHLGTLEQPAQGALQNSFLSCLVTVHCPLSLAIYCTTFTATRDMAAASNSKEPELAPLGNQVAGHPDGVQSLEGGRLVVKDCLTRELEFYKEVKLAARGEASLDQVQVRLLKRLNGMMPECHGSWEDYTGLETKGSTDTPRIVLENLTFGYEKPNVCDIKLGTQLWDEDASEEKKLRMEKAAASTTSGSHGIRLTGWQVSIRCTQQHSGTCTDFEDLALALWINRRTMPRLARTTAYQRRLARRSRRRIWNWGCEWF